MRGRLTDEEIDELLAFAEIGCLAMCDGEGSPYALAVNYWGDRNNIYFHCGKRGKKLDIIKANPRVCMFIYASEQYEKGSFSTKYESVVLHGNAALVTDKDEMETQLTALCRKLGESGNDVAEYIRKYEKTVNVVKIAVSTVTGKFNRRN